MEIALRTALLSWLADDAYLAAMLNALVEEAPSRTAMPYTQDGVRLVSIAFLRSRVEQRAANTRAILLEYRFRLLAA